MVHTDGTPTIACPLPSERKDKVKRVRLPASRASTENIAALRERYPRAEIVIPPKVAA